MKSLGIWLDVFRKQSVAVENQFALSQASDQVNKDTVAVVRKLVRGMVFHLNFGVELLGDMSVVVRSNLDKFGSIAPDGFGNRTERHKKLVVEEAPVITWWMEKGRYATFLDHIRRVFELDEKEPASIVLKKVCGRLALKAPKASKKLGSKDVAEFFIGLIGERDHKVLPGGWHGVTVAGNLSHLVGYLETWLGKVERDSGSGALLGRKSNR